MIDKAITVIENGIIFKFVEDITNKAFDNKTSWGFEIRDRTNDMKRPRWGVVERIGPKVTQVAEGDYILIENLQWTNALEYKNDKFWKTNETKVIMVSKEAPTDF